MKHQPIVCFGEILWDVLPSGMRLGGAPLNVAINASALGLPATIISAVGDDEAGRKALDTIRQKGLSGDYVAWSALPTGRVDVELDKEGNATYNIQAPAAWDDISWHPSFREIISRAGAIVFGTLVFRNEISRNSLLKALQVCEGKAVADLNLRKPFYDEMLVDEILSRANIAKMNEEELQQILQWKHKKLPDEKALAYIAELYELETVLLSLGPHGSAVWHGGTYRHHPGYKVTVKDTVGAGDAFLAGALFQLIREKPVDDILPFANAMGAYVANRQGATPPLKISAIKALIQ